jgi:hypothetical protein
MTCLDLARCCASSDVAIDYRKSAVSSTLVRDHMPAGNSLPTGAHWSSKKGLFVGGGCGRQNMQRRVHRRARHRCGYQFRGLDGGAGVGRKSAQILGQQFGRLARADPGRSGKRCKESRLQNCSSVLNFSPCWGYRGVHDRASVGVFLRRITNRSRARICLLARR